MKINGPNRIGNVNEYKKMNDMRTSLVSGKNGKKDQVEISATAKELLGNQGAGAEKIESLKKSVATGTYHVDAGSIAEKLLPYVKNNNV